MEGPNYFRAAYEYFARLEKNSKDKNSENAGIGSKIVKDYQLK